MDDTGEDTGVEAAVEWRRCEHGALLFLVRSLNGPILRAVRSAHPTYSLARSAMTHDEYWTNHCGRCGAALEDHELHCEPGVAFVPMSQAQADLIRFVPVEGPLEAVVDGCAPVPQFLDSIGMG